MPIIDKLATSLGHRDEVPNQELAKAIVQQKDAAGVTELVALLHHKDKNIQSDAVKVLYEIGETAPALIASHGASFVGLLTNKNNRLVWGAMTALDAIAALAPKLIYDALPQIIDAADQGSVIAKDHAVGILIKLSGLPEYTKTAFPLLLDQMKKCPPNQFPMYAENAVPILPSYGRDEFAALLNARIDDLEKDSKKERVRKILKKMSKLG